MSIDKQSVSWPGWETVRLIGRGSFGAVYEIERDVLGDVEKAALKVISIPQNVSDIDEMYSDGYDEESITSTFQSHLKSIVAEYSMMRKMNGCTNIVNCDDVRYVQHDDGIGWDIFIKMELLTPLTKALPAQVSEETVINIAKDICKALELCKKHEIVHRDIKPQNIFVSPNGDYKLGDFGIAKTVEKTMGGTKIGTYKYMAPEVYNNKPYGSAADIYSLGLVLYWLLNERRMPFLPLPPAKLSAGMDEQARNRRLSGEQFQAPKNGSPELKAIVMKACAYNVDDRYASAAEMLAELNRIAQPLQIATVPVVSASAARTEAEENDDRTTGMFFKPETKPAKKNLEVQETSEPEEGTVGLFFKPDRKPLKEKSVEPEAKQATEEPVVGEHPKQQEETEKFPAPEQKNETPPEPKEMEKSKTEEKAAGQKDKKIIVAVCAAVATLVLILVVALQPGTGRNSGDNRVTDVTSNATESTGSGNNICAHSWTQSTCIQRQKCKLCGIETGTLREHQWTPPTSSGPMKCKDCGETKGELKIFSDGYYGEMSPEFVSFTKWDVHPYTLFNEVKNCVSFTLTLSLWKVEHGSPYGRWEVYCKVDNGSWVRVADIDVQNNMTTVEINLEEPLSFSEVAVNRVSSQSCKHKYKIMVTSYVLFVE